MCYVVARAYSLEQQNAGRAHAGLCHASSDVNELLGYLYRTVMKYGFMLFEKKSRQVKK